MKSLTQNTRFETNKGVQQRKKCRSFLSIPYKLREMCTWQCIWHFSMIEKGFMSAHFLFAYFFFLPQIHWISRELAVKSHVSSANNKMHTITEMKIERTNWKKKLWTKKNNTTELNERRKKNQKNRTYYPWPKSGAKWACLIRSNHLYIPLHHLLTIFDYGHKNVNMNTDSEQRKREEKHEEKTNCHCSTRFLINEACFCFRCKFDVIVLFQYNSVWGCSLLFSVSVSVCIFCCCMRSIGHCIWSTDMVLKWNMNFAEFGIYQVMETAAAAEATADMSFHIAQTIEPYTRNPQVTHLFSMLHCWLFFLSFVQRFFFSYGIWIELHSIDIILPTSDCMIANH